MNDDSSVVYDFIDAADSSGYLISSILPSASASSLSKFSEGDEFETILKFFSGYMTSETQHFSIRFPIVFLSKMTEIPQILEDVYAVIFEGFQMPRSNSEFIVNIKSIDVPVGMINNIKSDTVNFYIKLESINNQLYNLIQFKMAQGIFYFSSFPHEKYMVTSAFFFWLEDLLNSDVDYKYPSFFLSTGLRVFNGLFNYGMNGVRDHGICLSAVVKYLKEYQNMQYNAIGNYYKTIDIFSQHEEFLKLAESPVTDWLPDFLKRYLNNELFELPKDYFINNAHFEWNINSEEDVSKTFTSTYQDLSAKIFKINFNYTEFDNSQNLIFELKNLDNNTDLALFYFQ